MNPWSYKAVIADIDGTLVQYRPDLSSLAEADAFIPDSAVQAVKKLHDMGVKVAAVTGRPYEQSKDIIESLGITGPCVFSDGATIRTMPGGEVLSEESMEPEILETVQNMLYDILGDEYPMTLTPAVKNEGRTNSVWVLVSKDIVDEITETLATVEGIFFVVNEGAGLENQSGLKVLSENANKGIGTQKLLAMLEIAPEDAACIGDGANDVLMFNECGLAIAMGNAEDVLKQKADHVVSDIDEDGFAEAVEFILES